MTITSINAQTGEVVSRDLTVEEVSQRTASEQTMSDVLRQNLRAERNARLAETDYFALSDSTLTDEMRTYRQALRDLPANTADPANPVWPVKPGGDS